ncbi:MAG TPA: hypothetical protein VFR02_09560, partial [bacterium]|nr:hypothetical protein [bacterium]
VTLTPAFSYTPTDTPSPTQTPTKTVTPTATRTRTPTPTPTASPTPTPSPSPTASPTMSPSPTDTPVSSVLIPFPNPSDGVTPISFYYNVDQPETAVTLKVFTVASRRIFEDGLSTLPGQHSYTLDWKARGLNPANGLYYFLVEFRDNGQVTHQVMKVLVLR